MKLASYALVISLMILCLVAGCGSSETDQAFQEVEAESAVRATLTASAPTPSAVVVTVVVTSEPPAATEPPVPIEPTEAPTSQPPAGQGEMEISLKPDGSGDYATLADAIRSAPDGACISLEPGTYPLDEAITVERALTLEGAGEDQTIVVSSAAEHVLKFKGQGPFSAMGITFRHEGMQPANVVVVLGGETDFTFCTFEGGVFDAKAGYGGNGLVLGDSTVGSVEMCQAAGNQQQGILLRDQARPSITYTFLRHNGACGLGYFGQTGGYAGNNVISQNELHGICIMQSAMPVLEVNTCRHNTMSGIVYFEQTDGEARGNDCSLNGQDGIAVQGDAQPLLESNDCFANGQNDIGYYENAGGTGEGNRCSTDAPDGLWVGDSANPYLANNVCPLSGRATQEGGSQVPEPRYNPDSQQGLGPTCFNRPAVSIDREWQTSAGDGEIVIGESVPLSLRNKWGEPEETYVVLVVVSAPDGTDALTYMTLEADTPLDLTYPDDFVSGSTDLRGTYTVVWYIDTEFVACNGFVASGGAGW